VTVGAARRAGAGLAGTAVLGAAEPALACASCFWGDGHVFAAYLGTAALMALLPLTLVGAIGWWIHRRTRDSGEPWAPDADGRRD